MTTLSRPTVNAAHYPSPRSRCWLRRLRALLVAGLCLAGSACSQLETFDLPSLPAHTQCNQEEKEGLTIAAELVLSPHMVQYHFGPDLRKEGFLPVFVRFENRGSTNFELERQDCVIILESGEKLEPVSPDEVFARARRSTLPAYVFAPLVFPAIWLHDRIEEHNYRAARTLFEKSLPSSLRLEGNDPPLCRVVFFRDPTGTLRPASGYQSSVLQLLVEVEGSRATAGDPGETPAGVPVEASAGRPPPPEPHRGNVIGRSVTFTVALSQESA